MNAIGADDWIKLQEEIESFENSDQKYLVIKHINGNYSAGAQLGETVNALMNDVTKAAIKLWNCKKPIISLVDGIDSYFMLSPITVRCICLSTSAIEYVTEIFLFSWTYD